MKNELLDMLIYEYAYFISICNAYSIIPYDFGKFIYSKFNARTGFNIYNKVSKNFAKLNQ